MTQEKLEAKELIEKFEALVPQEFGGMDLELAKQCALICIDEKIKSIYEYLESMFDKDFADANIENKSVSLNQVKEEIEKL